MLDVCVRLGCSSFLIVRVCWLKWLVQMECLRPTKFSCSDFGWLSEVPGSVVQTECLPGRGTFTWCDDTGYTKLLGSRLVTCGHGYFSVSRLQVSTSAMCGVDLADM